MRRLFGLVAIGVISGLLVSGCTTRSLKVPDLVANSAVLENGQSSHITVQHILIGFDGSVQDKQITRSKTDAQTLAMEVLESAQNGDDFDQLVEKYTDDSAPGIYHLANKGQVSERVQSKPLESVFPRSGMVAAFGDVGFPLEVGEVGLAKYDPQSSPFGWHVIKRIH
ncbi:MAG: peptidylprolyl isomerase [Pirellulaceae bacterium]|nr:peptidylprolyl isomerase [Pirellulaceae bacterium]